MMVLGLLEKKDRPCLLKILLKYLQIKQYNDDFFWSGVGRTVGTSWGEGVRTDKRRLAMCEHLLALGDRYKGNI